MDVENADTGLWSTPVLDAVWRASARLRRNRHRDAGQVGCPARVAPGIDGARPGAECARTGCADVFHDLSVSVVGRLQAAEERRWSPAWLATVVRNELADVQRRNRVRAGMPARPARSDGVAAAVEAAIVASSSGSRQQDWYLALFRMMRGHVYRPDRASVGWPVESWAGEKALRLGGLSVSPAEVAGDIRWLLDVAAQTAGAGWVHRTILMPLTHVREGGANLAMALTRLSVEDHAIVVLVAGSFQTNRRSGVSVPEAWRQAMRLVGGVTVSRPQAWVVELLEDYEVA